MADIVDEVWDYTMQVGLTALMQATRRVIPIMLAQGGGAIVNTASISGQFGDPGIAAYNAMKAAVINFTKTTAIEYASDNIRCNCFCPGMIETEMANVALFLASDLASYVTGAAFVADGGLTAQTGVPTRFRNG